MKNIVQFRIFNLSIQMISLLVHYESKKECFIFQTLQ